MKKIGLALSGGGFRATLFHLGVVRYLHDSGLLSTVSHITSVSGGSIIAAHLALNWDRYTGSEDDFDAAASVLIAFVRLDVRNRILRRFPLAFPLRGARRLLGLSNRQLTRPGLLEYHYEKYLYGDTSLFQLPEVPYLHILSTNLSEGRPCSFNRDGLLMIRRGAGQNFRFDKADIGLATVPMAVTASSAFPGFFPPYILTGDDVGAKGGEFTRQAYTDGGIFDNLGVRMFHYLAEAAGRDQHEWDNILVSDAGRPFQIQSESRTGGLVRTAMRATDILMDRVWQLETETFRGSPEFAFARITENIGLEGDTIASHPEIQRQLPNIRTDLDRFSELEIRSLIHHGYGVARNLCEKRAKQFVIKPGRLAFGENSQQIVTSNEIKKTAPSIVGRWLAQLKSSTGIGSSTPLATTAAATLDARTLHHSAGRRILSTLLDYRDWVSFIYVPIILPILILAPYFIYQFYEHTHRINQIVESLAQESRDLEQMTQLVDGTPAAFTGEPADELPFEFTAYPTGFTILQDLRIIDLRRWNPRAGAIKNANSFVYGYRRLKVRKDLSYGASNNFHVNVLAVSPETQVRFPSQQMRPKLYSSNLQPSGGGAGLRRWVVGTDLTKLPAGEAVDIVYEHESPGLFLQNGIESTSLTFDVEVDTVELSRWLLMPAGREYRNFQLIRYPSGKPLDAEPVKPVSEYRTDDYTILAFKLLAVKPGYTYDLSWSYR